MQFEALGVEPVMPDLLSKDLTLMEEMLPDFYEGEGDMVVEAIGPLMFEKILRNFWPEASPDGWEGRDGYRTIYEKLRLTALPN